MLLAMQYYIREYLYILIYPHAIYFVYIYIHTVGVVLYVYMDNIKYANINMIQYISICIYALEDAIYICGYRRE